MIEYTDFECPFCSAMANGPLKAITSEYVASGRLVIGIKNLPLSMHKLAPQAATMALCADDQGKYWEAHDSLFSKNGKISEADLEGLPGQIGLSLSMYNECLASKRKESLVEADKAEAAGLTIKSTPTYVIGFLNEGRLHATDVLVGARPIEEFRAVLDKRLKGLKDRPPAQ